MGGGPFGGPSRERAYLDVLRGPGGQAIVYDRLGSTSISGMILDIYVMTYEGLQQPIVLYIDEDSFAELQAPAGFICASPFPIGKP